MGPNALPFVCQGLGQLLLLLFSFRFLFFVAVHVLTMDLLRPIGKRLLQGALFAVVSV